MMDINELNLPEPHNGRHMAVLTRYPVVHLDPPWNWMARSPKGLGRSPKYPKLDVDEMKKLPIRELACKESVLLMWATMPFLGQAIDLGQSWGFIYKTNAFTWIKSTKQAAKLSLPVEDNRNWANGTGYWTMANAELCLLFTTKYFPQRKCRDVRQLIVAPRERHSKKPEAVYARIERLLSGPYLDIFAREVRPGWTSMGNEISGLDIREEIARKVVAVPQKETLQWIAK